MLPTTIHLPPSVEVYVPLSEYQSQTPETFHGGKPVLHYHAIGATAWLPKDQRSRLPFFPADSTVKTVESTELVEQKVDILVSSQSLAIFNHSAKIGLDIPYYSITLHAMKALESSEGSSGDEKSFCVFLQLALSDDGGEDDETFDTAELTIIPPPVLSASTSTESAPLHRVPVQTETEKLFSAISACADLNPDPIEEGDEDDDEDYADRIVFEDGADPEPIEGLPGAFIGNGAGGLPPPMPGSSGWITAENVNEYFDADGNWIGGDAEGETMAGELGYGAGTVHSRDETNGHADDDESNKRTRTE